MIKKRNIRNLSLFILVVGLLSMAASAFLLKSEAEPETQQQVLHTQFLPWHIEPTAQGSIRVFGLVLGETTLMEAEKMYHGAAEVSLFVSPEGHSKVEAYFDKVVLGGFSAQMVMTMELSKAQQAIMFERGVRVSHLGGGRRKVSLSSEDIQTVFAAPISNLVYLTRARLDSEIIRMRFGEPTHRIRENSNNVTHWLYPTLGLDVALNDEGGAVLQYAPPKRFAELMAPLLTEGAP